MCVVTYAEAVTVVRPSCVLESVSEASLQIRAFEWTD